MVMHTWEKWATWSSSSKLAKAAVSRSYFLFNLSWVNSFQICSFHSRHIQKRLLTHSNVHTDIWKEGGKSNYTRPLFFLKYKALSTPILATVLSSSLSFQINYYWQFIKLNGKSTSFRNISSKTDFGKNFSFSETYRTSVILAKHHGG